MEDPRTSEYLPLGTMPALQLLAGYLAAAGVAVTVTLLAVEHSPRTVVVALLAGVVAGALIGTSLMRSFLMATLALRRLARGLPVDSLPLRGHGALAGPIRDLNVVIDRLEAHAERERETDAFRSRLLEGVGAAAAQEERNRLARDLHDSIKQQMFSIGMSAAAARARWEHDPAGARTALADIEHSAREAQVEMVALLTQLRPAPLESVGLQEALRIQCEALAYRTGATVELEPIDLPREDRLPPASTEALFRIAQELLANVARHARARHVTVRISQECDRVLLRVRDDGQGFSRATIAPNTGLAGLRERAQTLGGGFTIESAPGQGTVAEVRLPLQRVHAAIPRSTADQEVDRRQEQRKKMLTLGIQSAQVSAILIFLTAPIAAVLIGTAVAAVSYARGMLIGLHLRSTPADDRNTGIREQRAGLLASILGLAALEVWYLPVVQSGSRLHFGIPLLLGLSLPLAIGALFATRTWYSARDQRLRALPADARGPQLDRRLQIIYGSLIAWLAIVLISVLFSPPSPAFPPHSLGRWADDAGIAILVVWPLLDGLDLLLVTRRRRMLRSVG